MKQFLLLFGLIGLMSFGALAQKFGHVNVQDLLFSLPEVAVAQSSLETEALKYDTEKQSIMVDYQTKAAEYQAKAETWPTAILESKQRELQSLEQGYRDFENTADLALRELEASLISPLTKRVSDAIKAVGSEHGFTYIFDTSFKATVYNGGEDVTVLVRAKLGL